jgi:hypothetical protein
MATWADLNERQQEYLKAIYETDQEQEEAERLRAARDRRSRPAEEWRWILYADTERGYTPLKQRIVEKKMNDPGTGSTFNALESRELLLVRYERTFSEYSILSVPSIRLTAKGRKLVRQAIGYQAPKKLPTGTLREWHWRAMAMAWKGRPEGVMADGGWTGDYGKIGWNTWLRLRDYKAGALVEEYRTFGEYSQASARTLDIHWIKLTWFGEQYYRQNWARYRQMYPEVEAPEPEEE